MNNSTEANQSHDRKMAESVDELNSQSNKLVLKGKVYSVDKTWTECKPDVTFKDKETEQLKTAHKTVLSQASPFFRAWFKEQWQQDKLSAEYPVPGDIDWEVFTNIISILYGEEVEFEEKALPDLFRAADYLQLDTLKAAIVVSLTEEWEVKSSEVVGAMLTAVASEADVGARGGGWLASVSVRYLIRNIQAVASTPTADISALSYATVKEIAQSEEVTAPEIDLYHFLRIWSEAKKIDLSVQQMEDVFSHVRYSTIPYDDVKKIGGYTINNNKHLWSAISTCPDISRWESGNTGLFSPRRRPRISDTPNACIHRSQDAEMDVVQFTTRKRQQPVLLLNSPKQNKWTKTISETDSSSHLCYSVVSCENRGGGVIISWSAKSDHKWSQFVNSFDLRYTIENASRSLKKNGSTCISFISSSDVSFRSSGGIIIQANATGLLIKPLGSGETKVAFNHPRPWFVRLECEGTSGISLAFKTM